MQKNTFSSSNKYSSLLGLLLGMAFVAILIFFTLDKTNIKNKLAINEVNSCLELDKETKTLKNICKKYSFSFPFASNDIYIVTEAGIKLFCQNNGEDILCLRHFSKKLFDEFEEFKEELEKEKSIEIDSWDPSYKNNNINCFNAKIDKASNSACFLKIDADSEVVWGFISSNKNSSNIEKMINSYQTW